MGDPTHIELKDNECAIVMNVDDWGIEFYLPKYDGKDTVPYSVVFLSVIAGLLNKQEPEFMNYMTNIVDTIMAKIDEEGEDDETN